MTGAGSGLLERLRKIRKNLVQDRWYSGWDSNRVSPEYKFRARPISV
jgi:hypothetical protein